MSEKSYNILIIDDDHEMHDILKLIVDFWGFTTYSGFNAYEGIGSAVRNRPVIIMLDIEMPEINGEKTLKLLKSIDETRDIPVVILSGSLDAKNISKFKKLGAVDFVTKPFSHEKLLERLVKHLPGDIVREMGLSDKKRRW